MTPASRKPIESRVAFHLPSRVDVVDGSLLAWPAADDAAGLTFLGGDDLLGSFIALSMADADEMATWLEVYGVLEMCQHGRPDRHLRPTLATPQVPTYCDQTTLADGRTFMRVDDLRRTARAFGAARSASLALQARTLPDSSVWPELTRMQIPAREPADWQAGRVEVAAWLSDLLRECGVTIAARWDDPRLRVTPEADGLFGTLALLLAREVGQGDRFVCDVCGTPVDRIRPPKDGEAVYCEKPACKREQQRRNQAKWRAKKRAEEVGN